MIAREQLVKASQGNPGAAVALGTMAQAGLHETIQKILDYGLRGTDIYVLFSDICEKDPQKVMDVVDSVPKDLLIEAAIGLPATLAIFPLYPILRSTSDLAASSGNRGFYFPVQETFKIPPELKYKMVPSGCYLVADFAKATTVADTVYINIMWDDLT